VDPAQPPLGFGDRVGWGPRLAQVGDDRLGAEPRKSL